MLNLIHDHPSAEVRLAALALTDALYRYRMNTGRAHVVIVKDTHGCQYRALNGGQVQDETTDAQLLAQYAEMNEQHNTGAEG